MKPLIAGLVAVLVAGPSLAAESFTIDARHTFPVFEINHLGFSTQRGRFNKTEGKITLDRAAKSGSVDIRIDSASIDMGLDDWDKHMRGEDFFNAAQFPNMTFTANAFAFDGDKPVAAEGTLTLLGVAKPVSLKIAGFTCGTHPINKKALCAADISTTIKRSEWGMKKYLPAVADEVVIKIPVEAFKD
ncbi:MAG: polyisoprenoid-binding protein [Rhodocyclaceae bacterium]|nr:polyisoprenoid-binding protein [Rhodocyclaceae bacterium]